MQEADGKPVAKKAALHPLFAVGGRSGVVPVATTWSNLPYVA